MPDISTIRSPLGVLKNPELNHPNGSIAGSKDTSLGKMFGNYYDAKLYNYDQQTDTRYNNQGWANSIGNFAADLGVKTISGVPGVVGSVIGLGKGSYSALTGGNFSDGFDDNMFLNLSKTINTWGDELFPHFQSAAYEDMNFGQKLYSAKGQLATANVETLGFLAQSFGLAGLLGKAQVGSKVVSAVSKGKSFKDALSLLENPNLAKIAGNLDEYTLTTFLTTNEAAMEGMDARDQVFEKLHRDRIEGLNNLTDDEIKDKAGDSLSNVFWLNAMALGVTNGFFSKLVRPLYAPASVASRSNKFGLELATAGEDLAVKSNRPVTAFEQFLFDKGSAGGMFTKSLIGQGIAEGFEENLQYSIQKVNEAYNTRKGVLDSGLAAAQDILQHGFDFSDKQRAESVGLGALIGGGSVGVITAMGKGPLQEARSFRENQEKAISELNGSYTNFLSATLAAKDEKTGQYQIDSEGNIIKDPAKSVDFASKLAFHSSLDNFIDVEANNDRRDATKVSLFQLSKLNDLAEAGFRNGSMDLLEKKLRSYKDMPVEELQKLGIEDPTEINESVDRWLDQLKRLEANYLSTQNAILRPSNSPEDVKTHQNLQRDASILGGHIVNLDRLIQDVDSELSQAIQESQLDVARTTDIVDVFSGAKDIEDLEKYYSDLESAPKETKIADLASKKRQLIQSREQLGKIYTKYLDPKNGFKNYKKAEAANDFKEYTPVSAASKTIPKTDEINKESVGSYVNKRAEHLAYKEKIKVAQSAFYADAHNEWLSYYEQEGLTLDSARSLERLVNTPIENKLNFYPDEAEKLKGIVDDYVDALDQKLKETRDELENLGVDSFEDNGRVEFDPQTPEQMELSDYYDSLENIKDELGDIYSDPSKTLANIQGLKSFTALNTDPSHFKTQALEELLSTAQRTVEASKFNGETISEDYDDINKVESDIKYLETLKENAIDELSLSDKAYKSLSKEITSLINTLKKIGKLTKENLANRDLKNRQEDLYYANGIINIWNAVGGETLDTVEGSKVRELIKLDPVLAAAAITDLLGNDDESAPLKVFELNLKKEIESFLKGLPVFGVKTTIERPLLPEEIEAALDTPTKAFSQIFKKIFEKEEQIKASVGPNPLRDFLKKYDIVEFEKKTEDFVGTTTSEELKKLLRYQSQLIGLFQMKQAANSSFSGVSFYTAIQNYIKANPDAPVPSSSQIRAVKELYLFNTDPNNKENELFQNGAALKAPAGAGKSLVISKLLKAVLHLSDNEIITAAPLQLASENIKESLDSNYAASTVTQLTDMLQNNALPKEVKVIVIDEAGALEYKTINLFASAFAKYNRNNPKQEVKFVFLYDPNQITPGNTSTAVLDVEAFSLPSSSETEYYNGDEALKTKYREGEILPSDIFKLAWIQNITNISPLSTTYRSDVSEIVDLQNKFKSSLEVSNIRTAASVDPNISTKGITGTFSESKSTITQRFKRSEVENPERSRTIIVGSQEKKDLYKVALPTAQILLVPEAQGITRDEVYVDVVPQDNSAFKDINVYNQFMYTALSRAKLFTSLSNTPSTSFSEDSTIIDRVASIQAARTNTSATAVSTLQHYIDTLKELTGKEVPVTPEDVVENTPPVTEDPGTVTEDEVPIGITPREPVENNTHSLWHPSSDLLYQSSEKDALPALKAGDELLVVKDDTAYSTAGKGKTRYMILQPLVEDEATYGYRKVAVLGENEVAEFKLNTGIPLESLKGYKFETGIGDFIQTVDQLPLTNFHRVFVQPSTADIQFHYANTVTDDFSSDVDTEGKLQTLSILKKYFETKYGNPGEVIEDYDDILTNFEKYTKIISFKTDKQVKKLFPNSNSDAERPLLGPPYLIIHGVRSKGNQKESQKTQFIRLSPSVLDVKHSNTEFPLNDVFTFIKTLKKFETELAKSELKGKYTELKNGVGVTIDKVGVYYPFHALVANLANLYKNEREFKSLILTGSPHLKNLFPDLPLSVIPKPLIKLAYELDQLVHGEMEFVGDKKVNRGYKGTAQKALDLLGKQNLVVTLPNGKNLILRDYRTITFEKGQDIAESAGFSLLGPITFEQKNGEPYNPLIKQGLISRLTEYRDSLIKRGKEDTSRFTFIDSLLKTTGNIHLNPITTDDLVQLFEKGVDSKGKFTNISQGFGIRTPMLGQLDAGFYNKDVAPGVQGSTKNLLVGGRLETTFEKVSPTAIVVGREPNMVSAPEVEVQEGKKLSPLDELRFNIYSTKATAKVLRGQTTPETITAFTEFMEATTFEQAVKLYRENAVEKAVFTTDNTNIYQALKGIGKKEGTLEEQIQDDLTVSTFVKGIGKGAGKIASRDFIRGSVLVRLFGNLSQAQLMQVSDFVRTDYYSQFRYNPTGFTNHLESIMYELDTNTSKFIESFNNIIDEYNKLIPGRKASKVNSVEDVYESLQEIVMISHDIRALRREGDVPGLEIPDLRDFAKKLVEADEVGLLDEFLASPDNKDLVEQLDSKRNGRSFYSTAAAIVAEAGLERSKKMDVVEIGDLLTPSEVEAELKRLQPPTLWKMIKSLFSSPIKSEAFKIVQYNALVNSRGEKVWGLYKNGVMSFAQHQNGGVGSRVVRHEFFHKIFWEYLTEAERVHVLGLAQDKWGKLSAENLEEKLATDFEIYSIAPQPNIFKYFWDKLLKLLGFTYKNLSSIEKFFESINNNAFTQAYDTADVERSAVINIAANFDNFKQYHLVKGALLESFSRLQSEARKGTALSFTETISEAFFSLEGLRRNPETFKENMTEEEKNYLKYSLGKLLDKPKVKRAFIDTFFGQAQTKDALVKLDLEIKQNAIKDLEDRIYSLENNPQEGDSPEDAAILQDELDGLKEETFDSELRDPSLKLTGVVKQRLVSIKYSKDGREDFADFQSVYSIILEQMHSLPVTGFLDTVKTVKKIFQKFGNIHPTKLTPNIRSATGQFMLQTMTRLENQLEGEQLRHDITFRKDASSDELYAIIHRFGESVQNATRYDVEQNPFRMQVVHQIPGESLSQLLSRISDRLVGATYEDVRRSYYFFEDMDFTRTLLAAVASLVKNTPSVAVDRYDYGKYRLAYFKTKLGGGKRIHESRIIDTFADFLSSKEDSSILFPSTLLDKVKNAKTTEERTSAIQSFFTVIGLNKKINSDNPDLIDNVFGHFSQALTSLQTKFAIPYSSGTFDSAEEYAQSRTAKELLGEETSLVQALVELVNTHYQLSETHSYTRGDNKKAFGFTDESYQSGVLSSIVRSLEGKVAKVFDTFKIKDGKLETNDPFLKSNIFFDGTVRIKDAGAHDSIKSKGNERWAKYLRKETLHDFRKRHFAVGFLDSLRTSKGADKYYKQFLPIPSNRTTIQYAEVKVLKGDAIDSAIKKILTAQQNRPLPASSPGLANNKTYNQSYQQWKFAGLEGSNVGVDVNKALTQVKQHVKSQAVKSAESFLQKDYDTRPKVPIDSRALEAAARYFNLSTLPNVPGLTATDAEKRAFVEKKNELITKLFEQFYYNFIVNQYSLSQMLYGDETFYASKDDQTKRIQIVTATGDRLLVDEEYGVPKQSKILVVQDPLLTIPTDLEGVIKDSYGDTYEPSDADGFMLPEFYEKLARSYGIESSTDVTMKPVYFSIENGEPLAIKYSVKVLSDELVASYPHLEGYRQAMRDNGAHQMVFASAVKIGKPKNLATIDDYTGDINLDSISDGTFVTLNNENFRFQLNPAKNVDIDTSNPSQLTAFMNTNGLNSEESFQLHQLNSFLVENNLRSVHRKLRLNRKGKVGSRSTNLINQKIASSVEGLPGSRDVFELLTAKDSETGKGVSLGFPLIASRVVTTIASMINSASVGFRFAGSKLVLQSDLGKQMLWDDATKTYKLRKLEWRDKEGYCEVVLPREYESFLKNGDKFIPGNSDGLVGFRIPSTNYHSGIPMKVVGFYDAPPGAKANVIIAPSLIVYYHGSDYDVDTLFVLRKEAYSGPNVDLNDALATINPELDYMEELQFIKDETVVGFNENGPELINGKPLHIFLEDYIIQGHRQAENLASQLNEAAREKDRDDILAQLEDLNTTLETISSLADMSAKNHIVHLFSTNMRDMKNRSDLLTPISFARIESLRSENAKELAALLETEDFLNDLAKAGIINLKC